jgi:predicted acyltransferase
MFCKSLNGKSQIKEGTIRKMTLFREANRLIPETGRVISIDVFRGLTIFLMIFVNTVTIAGVRNIPLWLKHAPSDVDGMTLPDIVFPFFLFVVGMAIPYAIGARIKRGESLFRIWKHILIRIFGLLVLGVFMVNAEGGYNQEAMRIPLGLWGVLVFICAFLVWNSYPRTEEFWRFVFLGLRLLGVIGLGALFLAYHGEKSRWMVPQWWGILGLIGWAYLIGCVIYVGMSKSLSVLIGALGVLTLVNVGVHSGRLVLPWFLTFLHGQAGNAAHSILVLAGVIVSQLFLDSGGATSVRARIKWLVCFSAALFVCGYFLRPIQAISKIQGTATWSLYCGSISVAVFVFLYWLVDIMKFRRWSGFVGPAARNPLAAYILFYIIYYFGVWQTFFKLPECFREGVVGIFYAIFFSGLVLLLTALLSRLHVRLRL